jgi:hypothetical protein
MFYQATLGMETLLEVSWRSGQWHRIFGVPEGEEAALRLLKGAGAGTGLGTIEVQSFPSTILQPAASGAIARVTYHTRDLQLARTTAERLCEVEQGHGAAFTMVGEMGERLEVTETDW